MMGRDSGSRYDGVAIALHWVTAVAILGLLSVGFVMTALTPGSSAQFQLYQGHKSLGITVLVLTLVRLGWRLAHRPPPLPESMPEWERRLAVAGHASLYALMIAMPLAGWAVVSTSPFNIPTFLYGVVPFPHLPLERALNPAAKTLHAVGAWLLIALLIGHIGAALRHHLWLNDGVMARMLPRFGLPRFGLPRFGLPRFGLPRFGKNP